VIAPDNSAEIFSAPLILPWMPGPCVTTTEPIIVSVTEFRVQHRRDLPTVAVKGLRMRLGWYAMSGALGLWLWSLPMAMRAGSISVWDNDDSLERFINLPHHVGIMNRYRSRGTVRSDKWSMERFEPDAVLDRAREWIGRPTICAR
jgi:hypothetical protein